MKALSIYVGGQIKITPLIFSLEYLVLAINFKQKTGWDISLVILCQGVDGKKENLFCSC